MSVVHYYCLHCEQPVLGIASSMDTVKPLFSAIRMNLSGARGGRKKMLMPRLGRFGREISLILNCRRSAYGGSATGVQLRSDMVKKSIRPIGRRFQRNFTS
jgi:hypothetical protein